MSEPKKRILVLSDPPAAPGYFPRLRYMCDYLTQQVHELTLVTEQYQPLAFAHTYPIITIPMYSGSRFDWFVKTVWTLLTDWHNRAFAKKVLSTLNIQHSTFDIVLCTTFNDFPLGAARRVADALQVPLICDIRDLDEQVDNSTYQYHHQSAWLMPFRKLYRAIHIRRRNAVLRTADAITTVSPWHADFIRTITNNHSPITVIYNGYDGQQFYPKDIPTDSFTVSYIGSLSEWQQPALEKVRKAIEDLNIKHQISNILWDLHTPQCNPIPHEQIGEAIRQRSIMLVFTASHTHGMLTTKFYEALGCEKPVLCVPSDKGALAELINYTNAGIATDDTEAIKTFILDKYREWQANGFTRQPTLHRDEFSRRCQTAQLEQIIQSL